MTSTITTAPTLAFELRLHALEVQILGRASPYDTYRSSEAGPSRPARQAQRPIARRVREIEESLDRAAAGNDAIKRLVAGYDRYLPLINQQQHLESTDDGGDALKQDESGRAELDTVPAINVADLLPDATKLTMILEAAQDIKSAERDLREIELLKKREVEGAGMLEDIIPYRDDLRQAQDKAQARKVEIIKARKAVGALLQRYHEFANTASELFLDTHHRMEHLEEVAARAERKKRKELAERY